MKLSDLLHIQLEQIDNEMTDLVRFDRDLPVFSIVKRSVIDLIQAGGKRLRPMMVIVGSRFGTRLRQKQLIRLAAASEFIHASSLIHDDMIDQADQRRQQPTLHKTTNVYTATHIGNYMIARIIEAILEYTDDEESTAYLEHFIAGMPAKLCLGEYQQLNTRFCYDIELAAYLEKTKNKTALLMATCLQVGARAAQVDEQVVEKLYRFGEAIGMAFQIRDDLLDFIQTEEKLGKPAGADLMNGHVTLPVIYALEHPSLGPQIRALRDNSPIEEFQRVIEAIRETNALERTEQCCDDYMQQAWSIIESLQNNEAHHDLKLIWHYFNNREF